MSDSASAPAAASSGSDKIVSTVNEVLAVVGPIAELAFPGAAPAIAIALKIAGGIASAEPQAIALWNQIKNGTPVSAADLAIYSSDYEAAYHQLNADLAGAP